MDETLADFFKLCFKLSHMLPLLECNKDGEGHNQVVHHSYSGRFAIRKDNWVYIDAPTGDDNCRPDWLKAERGYVEDQDIKHVYIKPRSRHLILQL